jgi:hypothetical protein
LIDADFFQVRDGKAVFIGVNLWQKMAGKNLRKPE